MIQYDFIEASFNPQETDTYKLSILAGVDSFAFIIKNARQEIVAASSRTLEGVGSDPVHFGRYFNQLLQETQLLRRSYAETRVVWLSPLFTLIPNRLFLPEEKLTYFAHLSPGPAAADLLFDSKMTRLQATAVYPLDKGLHFLFTLCFPGCRVTHFSIPYLEALLSLPVATIRPRLYVYVNKEKVWLTLIDGSELRLHNAFSLTGDNDLLYYCLLVMKQFKLNPEADPVYLSGQLAAENPAFRLLAAYLSNLHFVKHRFSATMGPEGNKIPLPLIFDLLCIAQD